MSHSNLMAILSRADVTALIFLVLAGCPAAAEDSYGVLAYSPATGALATKFKCWDLDGCRREAAAHCGKGLNDPKTCSLIWFKNECGAFAKASNGHFGLGWAPGVDKADDTALQQCNLHGGKDCAVRQHMCSDGSSLWFAAGQW